MAGTKYRIDLDDERLWDGDQPVRLTNKVFQLLRLFMRNPNRMVTKDEILDDIWGDISVSEGLIKEYVHDLREALGDNPTKPRFIETVRGRGYRFLGGIDEMNPHAKMGAVGELNAPPLSLAVLVFENLSDDPQQEFFTDGITDDIIVGLSRNPHLAVIARNSSFTFKGQESPARAIGQALGAHFVLEGSVRRVGGKLRVIAKLIDALTGRHAWAQTYDRDVEDIFAVQGDIVSSIVHSLGAYDGAIEKSARQWIVGRPETSLTAYECYLKAQEHYHRRHGAGYAEAEALYRKAIELDANFARAYSALATINVQRFKVYLTAKFEDVEQQTEDLALRAIRLDPDDYLAHWVLGRLYCYQGRHARSLAEFRRSLSINPNDANVLADFADFLIYVDRVEEALASCQRAIRLNPLCPDWHWWNLGFCHFHLGQYPEAVDALEKMTSPGQARRLIAAVLAKLGRLDEARSQVAAFMKVNPGFSIREWARAEPYINTSELERYVSGLRAAGFPE